MGVEVAGAPREERICAHPAAQFGPSPSLIRPTIAGSPLRAPVEWAAPSGARGIDHGRHARPLNWDMPRPSARRRRTRRRARRRRSRTRPAASRSAGRRRRSPATRRRPSRPRRCPARSSPAPSGKVTSVRLTFFVPENCGRARADAAGAHHRAAALRPVPALIADHAAAAAAAAARRPARRRCWRTARAARTTVQLRRRRRDGRRDRSATSRHDVGLFLFPPSTTTAACGASSCRASAYAGFEIGPRIGEVLVEQHARHLSSRSTEALDEQQDELRTQKLGDILRHAADRLARAAARGDRAAGQDADGAHRRGAAVARHGHRGAARRRRWSSRSRPQRAARRDAGARWASSRATTCRPRWRARWATRSSTSTPSRSSPRRCAAAATASRARLQRDAAADARRPPRGRAGRPVAPCRDRRDRVHRQTEDRAGAGAQRPLDRDVAARRLREASAATCAARQEGATT